MVKIIENSLINKADMPPAIRTTIEDFKKRQDTLNNPIHAKLFLLLLSDATPIKKLGLIKTPPLYAQRISEIRSKTPSIIIRQMNDLISTGIVIKHKEAHLNRTMYSVNWQKMVSVLFDIYSHHVKSALKSQKYEDIREEITKVSFKIDVLKKKYCSDTKIQNFLERYFFSIFNSTMIENFKAGYIKEYTITYMFEQLLLNIYEIQTKPEYMAKLPSSVRDFVKAFECISNLDQNLENAFITTCNSYSKNSPLVLDKKYFIHSYPENLNSDK